MFANFVLRGFGNNSDGSSSCNYKAVEEEMSETSTATIRVTEGDTVALNLGTQLAVVEDGQCYLIDISSTGEALSVTPAPVQLFQKINSQGGEVSEESQDESIPLRYYSPLNTADQQVILDDEQARAVANLLEFHNQQNTATAASGGGNNNLNLEDSTETKMENHRPVIKTEQVFTGYTLPPDPLAMDIMPQMSLFEIKKPLKTYGKRGPASTLEQIESRPVKVYDIPSQKKTVILNSKSENPTSILPIPSALDQAALPRRKRRCFIDPVKVIPPSEFKQQLLDTSDIVQKKMESTPPTKKAMYYLAYGGVGKFFAYPGRKVPSVPLAKLFFSRLSMITEQKPPIGTLQKPLEPLDHELRTPEMKEYVELSSSKSHPVHRPIFNDAAAMRTANSFDSLCKGMSKPLKFDYKRKSFKSAELKAGPSTSIREEKVEECSQFQSIKMESVSQENKVMINGTQLELVESEENSPNEIVYTIHEDPSMIKSDPEIFMVEENQETGGSHSNFEMLIAAAEHHNNLNTSGDQVVDTNESVETHNLEIKDDDEEGSKEVMYCTNENMEELIILGANGERYRVTTSNQGELTLWPEEGAL